MPSTIITPSPGVTPPTTPENEPEQVYNSVADVPMAPVIETPAGIHVQITDVKKSLWQYIRTKKLAEVLIFIPVSIAWEILTILLAIKISRVSTGSSDPSGNIAFFMFIVPILFSSAWIYRIRKQFQDAFLEQFAVANGYNFQKDGSVDQTYGSIFRIDNRQTVSDVISGVYGQNDLRLFLHDVTVGSGKSAHLYRNTVIELDLHGQLPNLLMVNRFMKGQQINLSQAFGIDHKISLEGDFDTYFTLYGQPGNEIEALQVFTPDTMALMEDHSKHYSVEFAGNKIYVYVNEYITDSASLNAVFTLAKQLVDKIAPLASRLRNDSAIVAAPVNPITVKPAPISPKIFIIIGVVALIFSLGFTITRLTSTSNSISALNPADISAAQQVAVNFIGDLQQSDNTAALALETPAFRGDAASQQQLQDPSHFIPPSSPVLTDSTSSVNANARLVNTVYTFSDGMGGTIYLKLLLAQTSSTTSWQIYGIRSGYTPLRAVGEQ